MKAVVFDRFGDPAEVLQIRELPTPEPGPGQVRVRMLTSPINPSDLLYVRGAYGRQPKLPSSAGFEGAGVVEAAGKGILGRLRRGRRVAVLNGQGGNWQEQVIVPARQVVPVPAELSDEQAATFFVNPASALIMVSDVLQVQPGAWLAQTAAGGALGRMVIRLGKLYGFRTINIVRRREQVEELRRAGGDEVICTADESIEARIQAITDGQGVPYAIDAVGGETGSAVARTLGPGGVMLLYGTLSDEPMSIHPRTLIAGQKRIEGFWLSEWSRHRRALTMLGLFRRIKKLLAQGILNTDVGQTFPFAEVQAAAKAASIPGRQGKVLLQFK
ncbi:MAG TPA: zinc-dependent alcohol dehydrogenase family protein [Gemmataceae bacterium]|nr:zinc-dependent alcohol dehydrogenase family protein [Gemmataceae bacterium]